MYRDVEDERPYLIIVESETVRALDVRTGARVWSVPREESGPAELAIAHEHVLVASDRELACFEYRSGERRWRVDFVEAYDTCPTLLVERDRIFASMGTRVACYDLRGQLLWSSAPVLSTSCRAIGVPGNVRHRDEDR